MAIDFDALDLVRGENKARSYNKKVDELQHGDQDAGEVLFDKGHRIGKVC